MVRAALRGPAPGRAAVFLKYARPQRCGAQAARCGGLSYGGAWALGKDEGLWMRPQNLCHDFATLTNLYPIV